MKYIAFIQPVRYIRVYTKIDKEPQVLPIIVSEKILDKLKKKHNVSKREIEQCFENLCGVYLEDTREDHKTDPVTLWFVSETNQTRVLKVAFMIKDGSIHIKSAYQPNQQEIRLYEKLGK